ncbi:MAG TPA: polymer-forming cytoskeletal protein [Bacteroidia bacterium]|nr:polymer-forming cytoskeletal protein [Bacteroidia bacterium]
MFKRNDMARNEVSTTSINQIGSGTVIKGDIISNEAIRIDGTLEGSLISKGKLVIGATGIIEGEVSCQNADIWGNVQGQITVSELLSLKASSKINGDIITNKLSIEPGATFTGSCSMGGVIKDIKHGEKKEELKISGKSA